MTAPARAAKAATATIPIVFNVGGDPVKAGLVASLTRPGGNVTGVNIFALSWRRSGWSCCTKLVPTASVIAHLVNSNIPPSATECARGAGGGISIGHQILLLNASSEREIDTAFTHHGRSSACGALLVGADPYFYSRREQIVALATRYAMPASYYQREFVDRGRADVATALASPNRIARWASTPGEFSRARSRPICRSCSPTKFELVINLKTAKTLGLDIPPSVLAIADEVIE